MGSEGSGTDQHRITPGERLLECPTITGTAELGSTTVLRCQTSIKTDG